MSASLFDNAFVYKFELRSLIVGLLRLFDLMLYFFFVNVFRLSTNCICRLARILQCETVKGSNLGKPIAITWQGATV
jgi:hypothetical protein